MILFICNLFSAPWIVANKSNTFISASCAILKRTAEKLAAIFLVAHTPEK